MCTLASEPHSELSSHSTYTKSQWLRYRQDGTLEKKLQYHQHCRRYFNLEATVPSRRYCNFKAYYGTVNGLFSQYVSSYFNVTTWETSKLRKLKLQNCAICKIAQIAKLVPSTGYFLSTLAAISMWETSKLRKLKLQNCANC